MSEDITFGGFVYRSIEEGLYVRQFSGTEFIKWQELTPKVNGSVPEQMEFLAEIAQICLYSRDKDGLFTRKWGTDSISAILDTYSVPFLKRLVMVALEISELRDGVAVGKR